MKVIIIKPGITTLAEANAYKDIISKRMGRLHAAMAYCVKGNTVNIELFLRLCRIVCDYDAHWHNVCLRLGSKVSMSLISRKARAKSAFFNLN